MHTRFGRLVIAWALVLVTVWLGDRLSRSYVYVADEPRLVAPEGQFSDWEKRNIELFRAASASVAYITTAQVRFTPLRGVRVAQGAGSGFIWDKAGHVVTNFHVIKGADNVYVQLYAGDPMPARVVGGAPEYDVAVVRLRHPPQPPGWTSSDGAP
jgi:2-alkenal reductase